jgi:hypothetical protein
MGMKWLGTLMSFALSTSITIEDTPWLSNDFVLEESPLGRV